MAARGLSRRGLGATGRPTAMRRVLTVLLALCAVVAVGLGGAVLPAEQPDRPISRVPLVGRVTTVCTAVAPAEDSRSTTGVSAVAVRQAPGRTGALGLGGLGADQPQQEVTEQGKGLQLSGVEAPTVLSGEGVMATSSGGAVFGSAATGVESGLSAAPCLPPTTTAWFSGLAAGESDRTDLILTNPDDTQAAVDLRFFGPAGRIVVAGSPGLTVEAHSTRTLALSSLLQSAGTVAAEVQAREGRVTAVARRALAEAGGPAGYDWQVPSVPPQVLQVVPAVPDGQGRRQLSVTNPGTVRAAVTVQVLGLQGPYTPTGAASLDVPPESTGSVDLAAGMLGEGGSVLVSSDQPVTASVLSASSRTGAVPDVAVQSAAVPLVRTGVSALATVTGAQAELVLSNSGGTDTPVSFEVVSYDGVPLRTDDVLLGPGSTATRRLTSQPPSYLVVHVPDGSVVTGGVVFSQPEGDVAGLTTLPITSPDVAGRAPATVPDLGAGR